MTEADGRGRPSMDDLRAIAAGESLAGKPSRYDLTPTVTKAIPKLTAEEDQEDALQVIAHAVFKDELERRPKLKTGLQQMRFIGKTFGWNNKDLARHLRIEKDKVDLYNRRGRGLRKKDLVGPFAEQFEGMFAIAGILERKVQIEPGLNVRRDVISAPNKLLTELGAAVIIRAGMINLAVNLVLKSVRHEELESGDFLQSTRNEPFVDYP